LLIALESADPQALYFTGTRLQSALHEYAGVTWNLMAGTAVPRERIGAILSVLPSSTQHPEGYKLSITPQGIHAIASTTAGAFYAVLTLIQIVEQSGRTLPALTITDWPDFPNRGVMLDISRDKVPTMETLFHLVDLLASWKVNQFQLYTEHTFSYQQHPEVWAAASPMTEEEILQLDAYCQERFVELVPNQNSFGHMQRWLKHDRYKPLGEAPDGFETLWGTFHQGPYGLCPLDPGSIELIRSLFDELLPNFSSHQLNVGCDETFDLGLGRSREAVEKLGTGRVYLDFVLALYREVKARGRTMQFWGDIIVKYPDLVPELPRDAIALEWGYQADHPFAEHGALFANSGVPFYVCPGTSSWNTIAGRTDNTVENLRNAAENGLKHGAIGLLNTDWGDNGHWQPLPVSYLGFAYGAAVSWAYEANRDLNIPQALSRYVFRDPSGTMGQLAYDLGNIYLAPKLTLHNSSPLFRLLQTSPDGLEKMMASGKGEGLSEEGLRETSKQIDEIMGHLVEAEMQRPDAALIQREFLWAADMLRHACQRGIWMLGQRAEGRGQTAGSLAQEAERLIAEYRELWHTRNRPGGFADSVARMEKMKRDYTSS
jgi:hypothetical protein